MRGSSNKLNLSYEEEQLLYPEEEEIHVGQTGLHFRIVNFIFNLLDYFFRDTDTYINHDIMLYYEKENKRKYISPDIMVVKNPKHGKWERRTYLLWYDSVPNLIFEIVSENTKDKDYNRNVNLFKKKIPLNEYIIIDVVSDDTPKITLYRYRNGNIIYSEVSQKVYSEELDMDICLEDKNVVFYHNGKKLLDPKDDMKKKGERIGIRKGEQIGIRKGVKETAKKMLEKGAEIEFIIEVTGLSIEEIEALK